MERIYSIPEQNFMNPSSSRKGEGIFNEEFSNIARLRDQFDDTLRITTKGKLLSWDAVKSRNRFEQCLTQQEQREYRQNELKELTSTLRERYNAGESPMDFFYDGDGKLHNKDFPTDTLETILERGVAYREQEGSEELDRERSEVLGIRAVQEILQEPYKMVVMMSPPGMVEGTPYTKHFVDVYSSFTDEKTSKVAVQAKRFATTMDYDDYRQKALMLDPTYFDKEEGQFDAYLLRNPIEVTGFTTADEVFDRVFDRDPDALYEAEFQAIDHISLPYKLALIYELCKDDFDPQAVALYFNTLLHVSDKAHKLIQNGWLDELSRMIERSQTLSLDDVRDESHKKGIVPVENIAVGCGESGGYFSNSVGMFGQRAEDDPNLCRCGGKAPHFHCPGMKTMRNGGDFVKCNNSIIVGKGVSTCPECGEGKKCA